MSRFSGTSVLCLLAWFSLRVAVAGTEAIQPKASAGLKFDLSWETLQQFRWELAAVGLILAYIVNIFFGKSRNERLAIHWTAECVKANGVLDKNFSLVGPGDTGAGEVLLKESMFEFKLWASGRRFCQSMQVMFILKKRQDLLGLALDLLAGSKDIVDVEVAMNEGCMPPVVLAIASPGVGRQLQKNMSDIETFTRRMEVDKARLAGWPAQGLVAFGEQSSTLYDLLTPHLMDLVFGPSAWPICGRYFRSLHITSEFPEREHPQVMRLSFSLPPKGRPEVMHRMLSLLTVLIDTVGTYKLSAEQTKRAQDARAKAAKAKAEADRDSEELRRKLEEKRERKLQEEKEKLRKMTPEQRQRYEEKKRKKQMKDQLRPKIK